MTAPGGGGGRSRLGWSLLGAGLIVLAVFGLTIRGEGGDRATEMSPVPSTSISTSTDATAITETSLADSGGDAGSGWMVTGVEPDDVLHVRGGPGVDAEVVGALDPGPAPERLSGSVALDDTGQVWWGVVLADGTHGFVDRAFLAPPAGWVVEIAGFARWFEAQGTLEITSLDGSPVDAEFSGPSLNGRATDGRTGVYASWGRTFGAFRVLVDGLRSGTYALFVGDSCFVDVVGDLQEPCGVETTFTVL